MNTIAIDDAQSGVAGGANARFVHLRLHSEFSLSDGIVRLPEAVAAAAADGMPALGMSDLANLFGMVRFYKDAQQKGLKPIIGVDVWLEAAQEGGRPCRLLLICKNREGYGQLCRLLSRAHVENYRQGLPCLRREWLDEGAAAGLLCLSGAMQGEIGEALLNGKAAQARALAQEWAGRFEGGFYIEIQRAGLPETERYVALALALAAECDLPVVATHPVQFLRAENFQAHEARVCIASGSVLADPRRAQNFTPQQYFKTQEEMAALFADVPQALQNTVEIARRCSLFVSLGESFLPHFPTPPGLTLDALLTREAQAGLALRLEELYPEAAEREAVAAEYAARLQIEIETINSMGFAGYFLIVADFINWAKENGVPVGPGRGSGAGSLVAYSLRITDLDPLEYALLFERFLNPERVSMPDFDIDFCQEKRYLVIDYVRERYGREAVSQIATFGTMASRAVLRDVGRVLGLPYGLCDRLSKLVPIEGARPVDLARAYEIEPQIGEMMADEQDGESVQTLWNLALPLEGLVRSVGTHAGGVLIAPGKLTDFCPLYEADDADAEAVSQFDKDDVEAVGLVKFDFLGLRNLTIIELALQYVERLEGERPDLAALGFEDARVYEVLRQANTTAIFQVESEGMKKLLQKLEPDRFEDIIAVLALYRPGPLGSGMVDDFILRKKGQQKINYFHPDLQACLEPTYGVIVYQEQVMQISQIIGGYTLGGADMLRRAMGKKKPEEMAHHRELMREGALSKGHDAALAMQLFDLMEKFAEYGFNKSHTAAYAVITYQTAWLKAHHTAAFMAATLSSDLDNTDAIRILIEDARANGLKILPPDINASQYRFVPVDRDTVRYGLGAIKGVGEPATQALIAARQTGGAFADLADFCTRIDRRAVNRRALEAMIRAGALDALPEHETLGGRAGLLANLAAALEAAEQAASHAGQGGLFDDLPDEAALQIPWQVQAAWDERTQLKEEKSALGFFFSAHPFSVFRHEAERFAPVSLARLTPGAGKETTRLAGVVMDVRIKHGSRGKMAFVLLEDGSGAREVTVYSEVLERCYEQIVVDDFLLVAANVRPDDYAGNGRLRIVAETVHDLAAARARFGCCLTLHLDADAAELEAAPEKLAQQLHQCLSKARDADGAPVRMRRQTGEAVGDIVFDRGWRVRLDEELLASLRTCLSPQAVELSYG